MAREASSSPTKTYSKSPCATERLAKHILQSPRLDGVNLPADSEQRRRSDSCAIVSPREMRGSQLIGLSLVIRHRGAMALNMREALGGKVFDGCVQREHGPNKAGKGPH